jgi:LacI family transcriptional regulator
VEYARRSSARGVDSVIGDDERGSAEIVQHLVDLGHRNIAVIAGPSGLSTTTDRVSGFEQACRKNRLPKRGCPVLYGPSYDAQWGEVATNRILDDHPNVTAIFASSSRGALGALKALRKRSLSVPEDVSLVGFLNPAWLDVSEPPLTTYELPLNDMGDMTARLLLDRIRRPRTEQPAEPQVLRFDGRMILRESTAPPRSHSL